MVQGFNKAPPFAFISDVHGNIPALEAVFKAIDDADVRNIYCAGDLLLGGEDPLACWRLLREKNVQCTRGASDTALATIDPKALVAPSEEHREQLKAFIRAREAIGDLVVEELRRLPVQMRLPLINGGEMLMVHDSPLAEGGDITHDISDEELEVLLNGEVADVVICGASHIPFERRVEDVHVVSVGSVGSSPEGPNAHYTIIQQTVSDVIIDQRWVEYRPAN